LKHKSIDGMLAVLSGAVTAFAFPKFFLSFLAWISLIPLFFALEKKTPRRSFALGFLGGAAFNAVLIYWIPADLSWKAFQEGSKLIIWPEFTVPLCFSCPYGIYPEFKEILFRFVRQTDSTLLLGSNETAMSAQGSTYFNTALCLHPDLSESRYYKMHLVPFGEYTPYRKIFFFIEKMTRAIGEITPGGSIMLHSFQGKPFGSPICFEIIFPDLVRRFVKQGASFLVTITNDGWYGNSSAPYQHFAIAKVRAVENRRFLLRAATTRISGIIDPFGRTLARSEMMTRDLLTEKVTPLEHQTLYTRYGDILPLASLTLSGIFFILALAVSKNGRRKESIQQGPFRTHDPG